MTGQAFLASCDELGDHISDYSQVAQRGSLILYYGGGEGVTGTSLFAEGLEKCTHERGGKKGGKGELKVRFGTLTGQIHNAGDDNERPSH